MFSSVRFLGKYLFVCLIFVLLTACAKVGSRVSPGTDLTTYGTFYVVRHTEGEIHIDEMIRDELLKVGLNASSGSPQEQPDNVDVLVTFEDRWMWDITMYLLSLTIEFREAESGILLATGQSYRPSLERRTPEEMVKEIMASILAKEMQAMQSATSIRKQTAAVDDENEPVVAPVAADRFALCIFPWKISAGSRSTSWSNTKKAVEAVIETLQGEHQIQLTHCYYKSEIPAIYQEHFSDTEFLQGVDPAKVWEKKSFFAQIEPEMAFVVQKGKQIGADLGLLVKMERPGHGDVSVAIFLVDINRGTMEKSENTVYRVLARETLKKGVKNQLAKYISSK